MASETFIAGLADLDKILKTLPAKIEAKVLRGAVRAGAKKFEEEAKALVPVRSGDLRKSIRVTTRMRRGEVKATVTAGNKDAFYAYMVEFGTSQHFIKPKNRKSLFFAGLAKETVDHPGATPKPFMRPALDRGERPAIDAAVAYIRRRLPKEVAKQ